MADLPQSLQQFLDDLAMFPDRADRIQALISIAERFREVSPEVAKRPFDESHRVPGCESEVFIWGLRRRDGTIDLQFAVENPQGISAKALAVILQDTLNGLAPAEIDKVPEDVVYTIFGRELSMGKSMGLMHMVRMVKSIAANINNS